MKRVNFIVSEQYGSNTDIVKYVEYLSRRYKVNILTFDYGHKRITVPQNTGIIYLRHTHSRIFNALSLMLCSVFMLALCSGAVFVEVFSYCGILPKVLFWKKMHIDVRTLSVEPDPQLRKYQNERLNKDVNSFSTASFISEGVMAQLQIDSRVRTFILPLGGEIRSQTVKSFDRIDLLYVGTLHNRNIIQTLQGLYIFHTANPEIPIHYDIIGGGDQIQENLLRSFVAEHEMSEMVIVHGQQPYSEIARFYDKCNVGLSYVPQYDCYQYQPPTKTYEYILSGLFCLATNTESNKEVIEPCNGLLHDDNPKALAAALESMWMARETISDSELRASLVDYEWMTLLDNKLRPIIEYLCKI